MENSADTSPDTSRSTTTDSSNGQNKLNYGEIMRHIFQVADQHKRNLPGRALLGALPFLIAVTCLLIASTYAHVSPQADTERSLPVWVAVLVVMTLFSLLISPIWLATISRISKIEYVLWVKAHFDNNDAEKDQSWKKALSLLWPSVKLSFMVFIRYYWFFWLMILLGLGALAYAVILEDRSLAPTEQPNFGLVMLVIFSPVIVIVCYFIYSQFIAIKLRYLHIIFVETYGKPGFTYAGVFNKNTQLVKLDGTHGKSFGQLLKLSAGIDFTINSSVGTASTVVAGGAGAIASAVGGKKTGGAVEAIAGMYGAEATVLTELLAQTVLFYVYYLSVNTDTPAVN